MQKLCSMHRHACAVMLMLRSEDIAAWLPCKHKLRGGGGPAVLKEMPAAMVLE